MAMAASTPMIAMTTRSSISVNPPRRLRAGSVRMRVPSSKPGATTEPSGKAVAPMSLGRRACVTRVSRLSPERARGNRTFHTVV